MIKDEYEDNDMNDKVTKVRIIWNKIHVRYDVRPCSIVKYVEMTEMDKKQKSLTSIRWV